MFVESFRRICWPGFINFCGLDLRITGLKLDECVLVFKYLAQIFGPFSLLCFCTEDFAERNRHLSLPSIGYGTTGKK